MRIRIGDLVVIFAAILLASWGCGNDPARILPNAGFAMSPASGAAPLTVTFTDQSTESPTAWHWEFGDDSTSDLRNPAHTYTTAGVYSVTLSAYNDVGGDEEFKDSCITVSDTSSVRVSVLPWYEVMATVQSITVAQQGTETTTVETYTWPNWEPVMARLRDSVIEKTWDTTDGFGNPYVGTMRIVFNDSLTSVISFDVAATILEGTPPWGTRSIVFKGHDVSLSDYTPFTATYRVWGDGCQTLIDSLSEILVSNDGSLYRSIIGFTCDDTSRVEIGLINFGD